MASIPCSIYVFLSLSYLGLQIIIENSRKSNMVGMIIMGVMIAVSAIFLIFKIIFSILLHSGSIGANNKLYSSLGIAVQKDTIDLWIVTKTFLSDLTSLLVSILLLVG